MPEASQNNWQRVAEATHNVVTPANAITTASAAMVFDGIRQMDRPIGLAKIAAGRALDILDGKVARATGTASELGEMFDATADKLQIGALLLKGAEKGIIPKPAALYIGAQNFSNALLSIQARRTGRTIHPNKSGKHTMFAQCTAIVGYIAASQLENAGLNRAAKVTSLVAHTALSASVILGVKATHAYAKDAGIIS